MLDEDVTLRENLTAHLRHHHTQDRQLGILY